LGPNDIWYGREPLPRLLSALLAPLGWLYCGVAMLRAIGYRRGWLTSTDVGAPVIVVGNLSVGGTGKTPLVGWLAAHLSELGFSPGIAARGYGAVAGDSDIGAVRSVPPDGDPAVFGDEPVLLAASGEAAVAVGRDRVAVARALVEQQGREVIITDDGLQHYRLRRRIEILVADGSRGHGNGRCLPAGPLREPVSRAAHADLRVATGGGLPGMHSVLLVPGAARNLVEPDRTLSLERFAGQRVVAVAGIGNPERFFGMLRAMRIEVDGRAYPDHHPFRPEDLDSWGDGPVLMTEKDAVKVRRIRVRQNHWCAPVAASPSDGFVRDLAGLLGERQILPDVGG
jgi:tetraacyldisaccharide 4'-kinase